MHKPVKLRDVIGLYTGWAMSLVIAVRKGNLDWWDGQAKLDQLRNHAKVWIGEDLLERTL